MLRKVLTGALDRDTFAIVDQHVADESFLAESLQVIQDSSISPSAGGARTLISPSLGQILAVVDRTADLNRAAESLVRSRFSFGGKAVYAPDIVLVNEFVKKPFLEAAMRHAAAYTSPTTNGTTNGSADTKEIADANESLRSLATSTSSANIVSLAAKGAILDITSR